MVVTWQHTCRNSITAIMTDASIRQKVSKLLSYMSSKSKYLLISVTVSLIVISLPFLISCTEQIGDESPELDELRVTSSDNVVVAVGDVMLSRQVGEMIRIKGDPKAPF